jgi:hypothetical protein
MAAASWSKADGCPSGGRSTNARVGSRPAPDVGSDTYELAGIPFGGNPK